MSSAEEKLQQQIEAFTALQEEFSRLEVQEKALRKQLNMPEQGGERTDPASLPPELRRQVEQAVAEAKRAGEARAAQSSRAGTTGGPQPGRGRRGLVRI